MSKRSFRQFSLIVCLTIVAGLFSAATASLSAERPRPLHVNLQDTGKTVALSVGQELIVTLPLQRRWDDNYWSVKGNSGSTLKLIAGPDTRRPANWTPFDRSSQVFYFRREAPGTTNLVMEQSYFSKPMLLKVVDR